VGVPSSKKYGIALEQFDLENFTSEDLDRAVQELKSLKGVRRIESDAEQGKILVLSSLPRDFLKSRIEQVGVTLTDSSKPQEVQPVEEESPTELKIKFRKERIKVPVDILPEREFLWLAIASFILGLALAFVSSYLLAGLLLMGISIFSLVFLSLRRFFNYYRAWDYAGGILIGVTLIGALSLKLWVEAIVTTLIMIVMYFLGKSLLSVLNQKIEFLRNHLPEEVSVAENYYEKTDVSVIMPGQTVWLESNERVPFDGVIIEGSCHIDESIFRGADAGVYKRVGDKVFAGGLVKNGQIAITVGTEFQQSRILNLLQSVQGYLYQNKMRFPGLEKWSKRISLFFLYVALAVIVLPPMFLGGSMEVCLRKGLALMLVANPWTFLFVGPLVYRKGLIKSLRNGVIAKAEYLLRVAKLPHLVFVEPGVLTYYLPKLVETVVYQDVNQNILRQLIYVAKVSEEVRLKEKESIKAYQLQYEGEYKKDGHKYQELFSEHNILISDIQYMYKNGFNVPEDVLQTIIEHEESGQTCLLLIVDETVVAGFFFETGFKQNAKRLIERLAKRKRSQIKLDLAFSENAENAGFLQDAGELGINEIYAKYDLDEQRVGEWIIKGEKIALIHSDKNPVYLPGIEQEQDNVLEIKVIEEEVIDQLSSGIVLMNPNVSGLEKAFSLSEGMNSRLKQNLVITAVVKTLEAALIIGFGLSLPHIAFIEAVNAFLIVLNGLAVGKH
jgi:Cd2+/Zn2+-exporting ATPase